MSLAWLKADVLLGSIGKFAAASLLLATFGVTGCGTDPVKAGVAKGCTLNSDCNGGLVCSFGLCHKECETTTDCPAGQRCVQSKDTNVCQLTEEAQCHFNTDCADPLICAIDLQCRNQCNGKADCLQGQECADHVCAEPTEVNMDGGLKGAVDAGGAGGEGNTSGGTSNGGTGATPPVGGDTGDGGAPVVACTPGGSCVPEGMPCQAGTITCDNDVAGCMVAGDADDGTECDTDKVCSAGVCTACKVGDTCQPDANNDCITGTVSCANGPACDAAKNVKAGTDCGTDKVCDSGACVDCKVGDACDPPGQLCKNGVLACSNGVVCNATTSKDVGSTCDTGKVCDNNAACVACVQNGACDPGGNECHVGLLDCSSGPHCSDTNVKTPDGTACTGQAAYNFCASGQCLACQPNNPCIPANPCHKGTLNCTNPPTCNDSNVNADDGLSCGDNQSCISGSCLTNDRTLTVTSGAVADVAIDAPFTNVTVHLVDANNKPVQGAAVTVLPSAGAYAVASAATNASGNAQITGRVGRAIGSYKFLVSAPGATSIEFDVNAVATAAKNVFTVVNVNHLPGAETNGAGTVSKLNGEARAVAAASDGTLYIADYYAVFQLTPTGVLTRIAGGANGSYGGDTGDSGLGTSVLFSGVVSLALDEANNFLYIADQGTLSVRQLDLTSGNISTYAGNKAATNVKPWGNTGPADSAYVNPTGLAVAANGDLYISDVASGSIRKVDFNSNVITNAIAGTYYNGGGCTTAGPLTLYYCGNYGDPCSVTWDKTGKMFISGQMCGAGNNSFHGVARVEGDGSLSLVAGSDNAAPTVAEGGAATSAAFYNSPYLAFDKGGNLFLVSRYEDRVRRIDAVTTKITTVAGTGGPPGGFSGDYAIGSAAQVSNPTTLAFDGAGNLYFADSSNYAVRAVYGIGSSTAPTATLATTSGGGQTVKRDAAFGALLVKLTDASNAAISGATIQWKRLETGSGLGATGGVTLSAKTNASGSASMTGRVGLATGDYHFEASYADIHGTPVTGSPRSFTVTATDPDAGTIFPVVNYVHNNSLGGYPGPATFAKLQSYSWAVAAASDGTIYSADNCAVYATTSRGEISVVAGTPGSCGLTGDSGPAAGAKLSSPYALALDETNGVLYIADTGNYRIRMVDLSTGVIDTFAGGGAVTTAPFGDGGQAIDANIGSPQSVAVGPDGKVYIPDSSHYYFRVVDPVTGVITKWFTPSYSGGGGSGCVNGTASLYYPDSQSAIRFKANGDAYLSGYICEGISTSAPYGIVLRAANGTFTRIAGISGAASVTENVLATSATIPDLTDLEIDGSGNLLLAMYTNQRVRKIDISTGRINTIAGESTTIVAGAAPAGYALPSDVSAEPGAYVAATGVEFYYPHKLAIWPGGHILIADRDNYVTRMIW